MEEWGSTTAIAHVRQDPGLRNPRRLNWRPRALCLHLRNSWNGSRRAATKAKLRANYTPGSDGTRNAARRPGSGGRPRGCGFEEPGGHVRVYRGGSIPYSHFVCLSACLCVKSKLPNHSNQAHTPPRPIFKHAKHTHAAPTLPFGDTPNNKRGTLVALCSVYLARVSFRE